MTPNFLSDPSTWLQKILFFLFVTLGLLMVLAGHWLEWKSDKKWYSNLDDSKACKSKLKCGKKLVMWGIFMEIIVAAWLAKDTLDRALKNDWRRQPIYTFEATATLVVRPLETVDDFESLPKGGFFAANPMLFGPPPNAAWDNGGTIHLYLGRSWQMAKGFGGAYADIIDDKAQRSVATEINGTNQWLYFVIHFGGHNLYNKFANALDFQNTGLTPNDLDAINLVLPIHCEIVWGQLQMSIDNGLTNRIFQIPKQTTFVQAATSVETNGIFVPIDFDPKLREEIENTKFGIKPNK